MSSVCRVCLAGNTTLHFLKNNQLVEVYEKLSNTKFNSEDARPRALCHLCYRKLLRCHSFSQMAHRSEKIFNQIYDKSLEATHEYMTEVDLGIKQELSVATMEFVTNDGNAANASSQVTIKDEPTPGIDIKKEVTTEQDELLKVEFVAEDGTKSQSTLEDDIDGGNDVDELFPNILVKQTEPDDSKMSFSCNNCNLKFFLKSKLISHIRNSHSQLNRNQYSHTKQNTKTPSMIEDKIIANRKKQLTCNVCDKQFHKKSDLVRHLNNHTGEMPFTCNVSDKQFNFKVDSVVHLRTHIGVKAFSCNVCDKQFIKKSHLVQHMRIHTGVKLYACNFCDKKFHKKSDLVRHMKIHTREKRFSCNLCEKKFNFEGHLVVHMRNHTGVKPFSCDVCDKQFNLKSHLVEHMRIHTCGKLYACKVCDKQFNSKSNLHTHMRTHTGVKPFTCNVCDKQYNFQGSLVVHMRTHTGEKPFACTVCDKLFARKCVQVRHMRIHMRENLS